MSNDRHFLKSKCEFDEIKGHDEIKRIFIKASHSADPIHIILVGAPARAKTMFLTHMMRNMKRTCFVVASNTTKAGLVNQLFETRPKYLLIDELDKMKNNDQSSLLPLMETGILSETKYSKTRQTKLASSVFATANSCKNIIEPLLSRFFILEITQYTFGEFGEIAVSTLKKEKVDDESALFIAEKVWNDLGSKDIRDVVKVA
jgi:Holliday junction resolvasome RuvABC ATP-dependent DNA helicase subunit